MYLARLILERGEWVCSFSPLAQRSIPNKTQTDTIAHYAGYDEAEVQPVFKLMIDYLRRPVAHEAFFKKYASKKFLKASILTRQWAKRNASTYLDNTPTSSPLNAKSR
ncbi:MAG: hypothetical protein LQ350_006960 [Teloschistes chrysophthalmus]|nr:MAG: hypothetical protein LQ350_006960 [Niorma chrysophthalma]